MFSRNIILFVIICVCLSRANSQTTFISSGKIAFEKKINLDKEWEYKTWLSGVRDKIPKFHTTQHILYFTKDKTLYEKGEDIEEKNPYYGSDENSSDIVYSDLNRGIFVKKQALFEESVLLSDSARSIPWEMTNEVRIIAGFECHKATAVILDSIFVVAFYADQITVSGGPMSYGNLPGMILGIAIPRMNVSVFATKVELATPPAGKFFPPEAKLKQNYKSFEKLLLETTQKMHEPERSRYVINALL